MSYISESSERNYVSSPHARVHTHTYPRHYIIHGTPPSPSPTTLPPTFHPPRDYQIMKAYESGTVPPPRQPPREPPPKERKVRVPKTTRAPVSLPSTTYPAPEVKVLTFHFLFVWERK